MMIDKERNQRVEDMILILLPRSVYMTKTEIGRYFWHKSRADKRFASEPEISNALRRLERRGEIEVSYTGRGYIRRKVYRAK
jgi:DNA-binding PadR family transcriptional regulator